MVHKCTEFFVKRGNNANIPNFNSLGPALILVKMGNCIGLSPKQRVSEITVLEEQLASMNEIMYLFEEVSLDYPDSIKKLEKFRDYTWQPVFQSVFAVFYYFIKYGMEIRSNSKNRSHTPESQW